MTKTLSNLANCSGIVAFAIDGTNEARHAKLPILQSTLSGILVTYGGGFFLRDLLLLHTRPALLSNTPEFFIALVICILSAMFYNYSVVRNIFERDTTVCFFSILDAIGLAEFIVCGVDRAALYTNCFPVIVGSGLCTGIGGGIIAANIIHGKKLIEILKERLSYRFIAFFLVCFYAHHRGYRHSYEYTILFALLLCPCTNPVVQKTIRTKAYILTQMNPIDFKICCIYYQQPILTDITSSQVYVFDLIRASNTLYRISLTKLLDNYRMHCQYNRFRIVGKAFGAYAT